MKGRLNEHPLPELIRELTEARASGALRLSNVRVKGVVYFDGGEVAAALTNVRAFRLTEVLRRGEAVPAAVLDALLTEGMSDDEAAAALAGKGVIDEAELLKMRERLSGEVLRSFLRWTEGEWEFDPRVRLAGGAARTRVEAAPLLAEGARQLPPELAASRVSDDADVLTPAGGTEALESGGVQLLPAEAFILSRVTGPTTMGELVAVGGLPEAETRRAVYTLAVAGLLRRERWARILNPEVMRLARARAAEAPAPKQAPGPPPTSSAQPPSPAQPASPASPPPSPPQPELVAPPVSEETSQRDALEELFERARGATHYEVLGVAQSVKPDELKRVYYSLAKRLHPDRFRRDSDEGLRQQTDVAFAKIAQAYDVLKDASLRASYDLKVAAKLAGPPRQQEAPRPPRPSAADASPARRAEERFEQGMAAMRSGDYQKARSLLGEAALLAPNQARYRAYYGRALSRAAESRRQAEVELQAAVSLEESNPAYHFMLAEFYRDVGFRRRAENECQRALTLNPKHADALRLMRELRAAGSAQS